MKKTLLIICLILSAVASLPAKDQAVWQQPSQEILDVLHSQQFPHVWASPAGDHLVIADRVLYPPLSELPAVEEAVELVNPTDAVSNKTEKERLTAMARSGMEFGKTGALKWKTTDKKAPQV